MPVVTLLTDFGTADGFVAAMKGVVLAIAPDAGLVDVAHDIAPGDIEAGAWVLSQYWNLFPQGTVHVAVIDPGVGGARRAIALAADDRFVVAPDNGLVTYVVRAAASWRCVEVGEPHYMRPAPSATFHGRDIFAPVAAHLARGVGLERMGPVLDGPRMLDVQPAEKAEGEIRGRIAHVDRFGNLITDIPADWVDEAWRFAVKGHAVGGLRRTYSDVDRGELVAVIGSMGTLEIAAREASAAEALGVARGDPVTATRRSSSR
jgi:S-adenosylmethionine hydrolase